jgi:group I intron endonuclease
MSKTLQEKLSEIQSTLGAESFDEDSCGVYIIVNPKGCIYVGSSNNIKRRFYQYRRLGEKSQLKLHNSLEKYGIDSHQFIVVINCELSDLYKYERIVGDFFNCLDRYDGLNLMLPGYGTKKLKMSEETREKISKAHKGKKLSPEQIEAISKFHKGRKQTKEHIEKRKMFGEKNPMYGKPHPSRGKKVSDEVLKKMSESRIGKFKLGENGNSKKVLDLFTGKVYTSAKEIAIEFNINYSTLKARLQGRIKQEPRRFKYVESK